MATQETASSIHNKATFPDLEGKVVLVTGAARGIGKHIAEAFAEQRSKLMLVDLSPAVEATAGQIAQAYAVEAKHGLADVTDSKQVKTVVEAAITAYGTLDVLVNNAGITRDKLLLQMSDADIDAVIDTNLKGALKFTRESIRYLRKSSGVIINISSIVGITGNAGQVNYSAAKGGLNSATLSICREYGKSVRAYSICPGFIDTDMTAGLPQAIKDAFIARTPMARPGYPREVAEAVVACATLYGNSFKNGNLIRVTGGM